MLHLQDSSTCSQYTEALSSSKPKVVRSCARMDEKYDDVIFDTTIRKDSVVTSYGFTCDSHHTTEVYNIKNFLLNIHLPCSNFIALNCYAYKQNFILYNSYMEQSYSLEFSPVHCFLDISLTDVDEE